MSHTHSPGATARQARQLTKQFTANLTGRSERGPDRKVRRHSYDVDDRRAKVFRPIGDGTTVGALSWIDAMLKTVTEWDDMERRKGGARPLGFAGIRVLETILGRRGAVAIEFKTGRLDPAIDTIARVARLARTTVVRALARLKGMKILAWVRRTQAAESAGGYGPQREQISNAYYFTPEELPVRVLQRLRDLLARRRLRRSPAPQSAPVDPTMPQSSDLREALAALGRGIPDASPPDGQYPRSGVEG